MIRTLSALAALGVLASCVATGPAVPPAAAEDGKPRLNVVQRATPLPPMKRFLPGPAPQEAVLANADLVRNFIDLSFRLESGREVPQFSRFDGPIKVRVLGDMPATLPEDLAALITRLRREAGIDISQTVASDAQITINVVRRAQLQRYLPEAACFVIPNVSTLQEFKQARRKGTIDWTALSRRDRLAIFVPSDVAPQELRDCLHEELAQALGPVNDLYRLPSSVFNDDNFHTVLTAHDMLILRATYDPDLRNGMSKAEVARALPAIFARINPRGRGLPPTSASASPRSWIEAVQTALGPGASPARREAAALQALRIAEAEGWQDHRRGFSHYILARLSAHAPDTARRNFQAADRYFAVTSETRLHRAFAAAQLSADALRRRDAETALAYVTPYLSLAEQARNATLLATLMLLQAEALEMLGRTDEARGVRLDSLGWARYGFGTGEATRERSQTVSALKTSG